MKVRKIVALIKQSYDQPLLFHRLHCHLAYVLETINPLLEMSDDWSKMLIYSCIRSKHANQGLETKILALLKTIRPPVEKGARLRLWIVLYYMKNRPSEQINHLIVYELINNFMGVSSFTDGFILSVFSSAILGPVFGLTGNKKMRDDVVVHLLSVIKSKPLGMLNRITSLPCYVNHEVEPFALSELNFEDDVLALCALEHICFYAKYTKYVELVKKIIPDDPCFVALLREFVSRTFKTNTIMGVKCDVTACVMEDMDVLDGIRRAYETSRDRVAFVSRVIEFVTGLK